jgi:hypothetical protein
MRAKKVKYHRLEAFAIHSSHLYRLLARCCAHFATNGLPCQPEFNERQFSKKSPLNPKTERKEVIALFSMTRLGHKLSFILSFLQPLLLHIALALLIKCLYNSDTHAKDTISFCSHFLLHLLIHLY